MHVYVCVRVRACVCVSVCLYHQPLQSAALLQEMGIKSIRLMTNNPRKLTELAALGIPVTGRIPCQVRHYVMHRGGSAGPCVEQLLWVVCGAGDPCDWAHPPPDAACYCIGLRDLWLVHRARHPRHWPHLDSNAPDTPPNTANDPGQVLIRTLPTLTSQAQVQAQKYNAGYLGAKHRRMAHILNPALFSSTDADDAPEPLEGQFCFWDHEVISWLG